MNIEAEIKGHFRNEYHKGIINLNYTVKQIAYQFYKTLKKHELTEQQYNVLRVLRGFRSESNISIGFVKERMLDKNSDVSRIVDKLVERELLDRKECPIDRRQKDLKITDKGLTLLNEMFYCEKEVDNLLTNLSIEEVKQLNFLLDKIRG
ncbi:MAG: MarR family transcriptional regulator [Paludibacteraceae bacterium]|nr:MarR family transcriptional regulator [Paludibacteraceae bacterium]